LYQKPFSAPLNKFLSRGRQYRSGGDATALVQSDYGTDNKEPHVLLLTAAIVDILQFVGHPFGETEAAFGGRKHEGLTRRRLFSNWEDIVFTCGWLLQWLDRLACESPSPMITSLENSPDLVSAREIGYTIHCLHYRSSNENLLSA
jgi:hypothetical protein